MCLVKVSVKWSDNEPLSEVCLDGKFGIIVGICGGVWGNREGLGRFQVFEVAVLWNEALASVMVTVDATWFNLRDDIPKITRKEMAAIYFMIGHGDSSKSCITSQALRFGRPLFFRR